MGNTINSKISQKILRNSETGHAVKANGTACGEALLIAIRSTALVHTLISEKRLDGLP